MSSVIFEAIRLHVEAHPEIVEKVGTVFQFKLTGPDSAWFVDVKNGKGAVGAGTAPSADCTLELSDADFVAMSTGQADPQKLYFGGKLKIGGNLMASQKLMFLRKIEPATIEKAMKGAGGGAGAPAAAAPAAAPAKGPRAKAVFEALGARLAKTPALAAEVGKTLQFRVKSPDAAWVVDLAASPPAVREGTADAAAVFTIDDEDLAKLAADPGKARDMFQHGKLRVDGDVRLAHKLGFLGGLGQ